MLGRSLGLALVLVPSSLPVSALASTGSQPYESCLTAKALELEATGIEVDEVIAQAERSCGCSRARLTSADAGEIGHTVRLAVIQQRSNARITVRRF